MFLLRREVHTNSLFKDCNILKFHDKVALENSISVHKSLNNNFSNYLIAGLDVPHQQYFTALPKSFTQKPWNFCEMVFIEIVAETEI